MFGKKTTNKNMAQKSVTPASGTINSLVVGTKIEGKITASSDIRIDGGIKGTLNCTGRVIIGQQGSVQGEIFCQNAIIEGQFDGQLEVKETLSVKETAVVTGDIRQNFMELKSHVYDSHSLNVSFCLSNYTF